MADSPAKFSDEGKPYQGTETPFGHVHHMADSLTTLKYAELYNNFNKLSTTNRFEFQKIALEFVTPIRKISELLKQFC